MLYAGRSTVALYIIVRLLQQFDLWLAVAKRLNIRGDRLLVHYSTYSLKNVGVCSKLGCEWGKLHVWCIVASSASTMKSQGQFDPSPFLRQYEVLSSQLVYVVGENMHNILLENKIMLVVQQDGRYRLQNVCRKKKSRLWIYKGIGDILQNDDYSAQNI